MTERKREEEEGRRAAERLSRGLVENAPAVLVAGAGGRIAGANPAAEDLFGRKREELVGLPLADLVVADERPAMRRALEEALGDGLGRNEETRALKADGTEVPIEVAASAVQIGTERFVLAIVRDVSRRRAVAEHRRFVQELDAVARVGRGVAHDFNNVLTAILGYTEILADALAGDPARLEEVDEIRRAGERASTLTRQLLAFARRPSEPKAALDLNAIVRSAENTVRRLTGDGIAVAIVLADDLGSTRADAGQVEQILSHLAANARDSMPDGGNLSIATSNVEIGEASVRERLGAHDGRFVELAVSDDGRGMDDATRARIFEPFFTTKEKGKAAGLGLSTVFAAVNESGGHILVETAPGRGATFRIRLPRVETEAEESPAAVPEPDRGSAGTVLLVEAEPAVRALAEEILERLGYSVLAAASGAEALETASAYHGSIDLVLTDVAMPEPTGPDLVARLAAARPGIRAVSLSNDADVLHGDRIRPGASLVQKPFTPETLADRMREALLARG